LNIDNNESKDNDESSREDDGVIDESDAENSDPEKSDDKSNKESRKESVLLKTGRLGRRKFISLDRLYVRIRLRMRSWREIMPSCN